MKDREVKKKTVIKIRTGKCEVCGNHRSSNKHKKSNCSKKLQKKYEEVNNEI